MVINYKSFKHFFILGGNRSKRGQLGVPPNLRNANALSASTRVLGSRSSFHEGSQNLAQPVPLRTRVLRAQNRPVADACAVRPPWLGGRFTGLFLSRRFCAFSERAGTATPNSSEPKTAEGNHLYVKNTSRWNKLREGVGVGSAGVSRYTLLLWQNIFASN